MSPNSCPECNTPWREEETIFQHFLNKGKSVEEAAETASHYGCTPQTPKHFGKDVVGIEIQGHYDGVSYWQCKKCEATFNRFTMKKEDLPWQNQSK